MKSTIISYIILIGLLSMFLIPPAIWVMKSSFEASAYNRATGANVSTWDAMWIELRVTTPAKP